jgi:hypothetical protein
MSILYICTEPNPYIKFGKYYEDNEDGFVQEVKVFQDNGRLGLDGWTGMAFPTSLVRKYLIEVKKKGLDPNVKNQQRIEL